VIAVYIILAIVVLLLLSTAISYNRFVSQRNLIKNAFANIDTELRRRYDLIPNLVTTVQGYAAHEREVFEEVARTRSAAMGTTGQSPAAQAAAEGPFVAALGKLFAVAENYPELKANQNFLALQGELTNTEDRIQASRRFYNANVQNYNRRVQAFPSAFIAGMFHFGGGRVLRDPGGRTGRRGAGPAGGLQRWRRPGRPGPGFSGRPTGSRTGDGTGRRAARRAPPTGQLTRGDPEAPP